MPGDKKRAVRAGDVVGRYELVEIVGEGGMATVFRARDRELRRDVAIKVLFPHLARRPEIVHRFQREARAAATLEHANILRIYDIGDSADDSEDPPFIVMELIRGRTLLAEIEQRGPMFAEVVACLGALLADALSAAHAAGIVHRDIKPANVLVAGDGRVLLADFGVARLETEDSLVTKTGALLGTPAYMSPEQAAGDTATARSDLYSLGATLYQLATGALPYTGSPAKVLSMIAVGQLVPAVKRRAQVGPDLSRVIDLLMASEPELRPANARDVAVELRAIATAGGLGEPADEVIAYFADPDAFMRAKTPAVVRAVIAAGQRAGREGKLPRAIALADRAVALAPDDPDAKALVLTVTRGASRRKTVVLGGAIAIVACAAVAAGVAMTGNHDAPAIDAGAGVVAIALFDAAAMSSDATPIASDAAREIAPSRDAGNLTIVRHGDAGISGDAAAPLLDAAIATPPLDAALGQGAIVVTNDTWCDVSIDGVYRERRSARPIGVEAGHHRVTCAQPGTTRTWTREVDVAANATVTASGTMLGDIAVTTELDATLDGTPLPRGTTRSVKAGRHAVEAGGVKRFLDLRAACTIRQQPELDCY